MSVNRVKILKASAGSGKTYRLAYEYIKRVVTSPIEYSKILAVTFTNKATEEMKSRILARLNDLSNAKQGDNVDYLESLQSECGLDFWQVKENARRAKSYILHDYDNFAISTIDKFFQRIARSFFKELNLEFNYDVELSQDSYISQAVERVIETSKSDPLLYELLGNALNEQLENNGWDIRKRLCAVAGVLTREGYQKIELPVRELMGLLGKAKDELNMVRAEIIKYAQDACQATSAAGLSGIDFAQTKNSFVSQLERMAKGEIKGYNSYFLKAIDGVDNWSSKTSKNKQLIASLESTLKPLLPIVKEKVDNYIYVLNSVSAVEKNFSLFLLLDYISIELERLWGEQNKLPIFKTTDLIADITSASDAPFIYEKIGAHYGCYMIDEFQDTSQRQWEGFKPLLEEALSISNVENVMLIGDVKQAIYRWRGGDWNILASGISTDFEGMINDDESLSTNYRSHSNVINFNNSLFRELVKIERDVLGETVESAYKQYEQGVTSKDGGYIEVVLSENEGEDLLVRLEDLIKRGYSLRDIAILTRRRVESSEIANLLVNNGYSVVSDEALLLTNSSVVRFLIAMLRLSVNEADAGAIAQVNFFLGIGMESNLSSEVRRTLERIRLCNTIKATGELIRQYDLEGRDVSYLQAIYDHVYRFCVNTSGDVGQFIEWFDLNAEKLSLAVPQGQDAITIITIHKAKGLQYPVVLLPYATWSLLPNKESKIWGQAKDGSLAEMGKMLINYVKELENSTFCEDYKKELTYSHIDNLNLLYVAVTRAEKELFIFVGNDKANTIGALIGQAVVAVENLNKNGNVYFFGNKLFNSYKNVDRGGTLVFDRLTFEDATLRIATRLPHFSIEDQVIDNRQYGIVMHKLFSRVEKMDDFETQINVMESSGEISKDIAENLRKDVKIWTTDKRISEWFSEDWEVFSERSILSKDTISRRPDRVLVKDRQAIVVDYKFGRKNKSHDAQVLQYADLLKKMGYQNVETYLWYITENEIINASN